MGPAPELQDIKLADQHLSHDILFMTDVRDYMRERAEMERECSKRLDALARKFEVRRDKLDAKRSSLLTSAGISGSSVSASNPGSLANSTGGGIASDTFLQTDSAISLIESSSARHCWGLILQETTQSAKRHASLADSLLNGVAEQLKGLGFRRDECRKKHLAYAQRLRLEREKMEAELEKTRSRYFEACDLVDNSKLKNERGSDEKSKEKFKRVWHQEILDMNNAKNLYLLSIKSENAAKSKYYSKDIPELLDNMRELGQLNTLAVKQIWQQYTTMRLETTDSHLTDLNASQMAISAIDHVADSRSFDATRSNKIVAPADFSFIPCSFWVDLDEMITDEFSVIFMRNKLTKIRTQLAETEHDISVQTKGIVGMNNLLNVYTSQPQQGEPDDVRENILDTKRGLVVLQTLKCKLETQIQNIVETVGGGFYLLLLRE
ncbi:hypothetical protein BASA50_002805 [Batrachochytrium salamandrivorans]|uniref:F-BAR domain-containing protein n=1 Tax=Batrachochytrium salamandrivorans TaxID=1357716 RepID=A0ABQ8FKT4_9FUNG|nr:hypothetical protein BASA62_004248 [Batrachochytrium salamandrivorans]KAH6595893.1 hypothetical protein BASA61_003647 [Batrachochytrium salamandrivorans]KAH6599780.1 hypothetical protein BASA50_002805 [Batrachochytrium salamandrivorans]KAH9274042.1 hypothetical protein BASA83_003684 [Batrachochytrium salamandrivorans]